MPELVFRRESAIEYFKELVDVALSLERAVESGVQTRVRGWGCKTCAFAEACAP